MPNQQLIDYIKQARAAGKSDAEIKSALLSAGWQEGVANESFAAVSVASSEFKPKTILSGKLGTISLLIIKILAVNWLLHALFIGSYDFLLSVISYTTTRMLNILLINAFVYIIFVATSFLLTIKIFNRKNSELIRNNIGKIVLLIVILPLIISFISVYYKINVIGLARSFSTPFYVYVFLGSLLSYIFLYVIYLVFFLRKYVKIYFAVISLIIIVYGANLAIYLINFNRDYKNANIQESFYLYPKTDLRNIIGFGKDKSGNSATHVVALINNLSDRDLIKDNTNKITLDYIRPTDDDLKVLSQIADSRYVSFSEAFVPDDILLYRSDMIIPIGRLRNFSNGVIKLADELISAGQLSEAENSLNNLLLFGDQLFRNRDDDIIV